MLQLFKEIFNKDDIDFSHGQINADEFHVIYFSYLKSFRLIDTGNIPKWTVPCLTFILMIATSALVLESIAVYRGISTLDLSFMTESATYVLVLSYEMIILCNTKLRIPEFGELQKALREDFYYVCSRGQQYRKKFFEHQLLTSKVYIIGGTCTFGVALAMIFFAIVSLILCLFTNFYEDTDSRPFIFPFWLKGVDFKATPLYEISIIYGIVCIFLYAYTHVFSLLTQIMWISEIMIKADIVAWRIHDLMYSLRPTRNKIKEDFYTAMIKKSMREIIQQHQSMYKLLQSYAKVHLKLLVFEQSFCSPIICLTAFCVAEKLDRGEFNAIPLLLFIATIVMYFIPSYLCTIMTNKVRSICDTCWDTPFWNASPVIRPYMVLIIQKSLRPLPIKVTGLRDISLETFSNKMASAYSLFNMLRQTHL